MRASAARTPALPRRSVARLGGVVLATAITLAPLTSPAQTPEGDSGIDLLQPSLESNPRHPPRFHRPGERATARENQTPLPGAFTASQIYTTPIYGSPTGFGAGDTGFDSSNTARRKRRPRRRSVTNEIAPSQQVTFAPLPALMPPLRPKPPPRKPPPVIYPAKAAARRGAALPPSPEEPPVSSNPTPEVHPLTAADRRGGALPMPPPEYFEPFASALPLVAATPITPPATPSPTMPPPNTLPPGMQPLRPLPIAEGDPYTALGIRAGSFVLFPSLDLSGGYSTNPERMPGFPSAAYFVGGPDLKIASDWDRHSLTADITGNYSLYGGDLVPSLNAPYFNSKVDGRIDVSRQTQIIAENRFLLTTENPGSPNLQTELAKLPIDTDVGGTLGVVQEFNRLSVAALGTFDRAVYYDSLLTNGEKASNADMNFNQTAGILRLGYDLDPGLAPFVQVQEDERIHDLQFDRSGLQRNSVGTTALAGGDLNLFGSLTGEMAGGWVFRSYEDPTLPDISGFIANGALTWQATRLTTAKLTAASEVYETIVTGASGQLARDVSIEIDHAFLRRLVGTASAGYGTDDYVGSPLRDSRYFVSAGLIYTLTREVQVRALVRQDWQLATLPDFSFMATTYLLGLHLQR